MAKSYRERIEHLLGTIREPLATYAIQRIKAKHGEDWRQAALDYLGDRHHGHSGDDPRAWDIQAWLNFYIGAWSPVFGEILGPGERNYFFRLKDTRNAWAHQGSFDFDKTYRAHDDAQLAMEAINSPAADTIAEIKEALQREKFAQPTKKRIVKIKSNPLGTIKPWRQVIKPHADVQKGTFSSSEFAADLWEVHKTALGIPGARSIPEYADPKTFFGRTYITQGLGNLLRVTAQRLRGSGGEPVVQLQTNFGGGKTHSMLAVYHMTSGVSPQDLPGLDSFFAENQLSLPKDVRRAVVVGNKIPLTVDRKPDGTEVKTLWGEIAWQLGGLAGYEMIRSSDEQATNPGDKLTELLKRFSPAVILIDEWVAYARQLYERSDLAAGGSFDTQFTFAQTLTEAAKIAGGVVIVVSLPESANEVGGSAGQETLDRLRQVMGRIESTWQPASRDEAYEIVRLRLFEGELNTTARSETVRAFQELYKNAPEHFPQRVREAEYAKRIEATYPIHPELFDALYRTWSTIPGFQQTRGVLRLMAAVIHSLWVNQDAGAIIMPAMVPLDDPSVRSDFTKFLPNATAWANILDSEIDGQTSLAAVVDREQSAFGQVAAARRVARSLFLETSPVSGGNNRGVDDRAIKVACTQPGEKPAVYGDAMSHLAQRSVYLYSENGRYWYSENPTLRQVAEDRAAQYLEDDDQVLARIETILKEPSHAQKGDFARLHSAPKSPADVSDEERVALVVLPPIAPHARGDADSEAMQSARLILDSRGSQPRINKNMLVFAAADATRISELRAAVARALAWDSIVQEIRRGSPTMDGVTQGQAESAREDLRLATERVTALIPETYRWMLLPAQENPSTKVRIDEHAVAGSEPAGIRLGRYLQKKQWLMPFMDGQALRLEIDQIPLWNGDDVSVEQLCQYFARHVYLPRIGSRETVFEAIRNGVADLSWDPATFAWAARRVEAGGSVVYEGLVAGQQVQDADLASGFIVKPDVAARVFAQIRKDTVIDEPARGGDDTSLPDREDERSPDGGPESSEEPTTFRRYFGTVELDAQRASTQMGTILEEVISHLNATGATVSLSLEVSAELPSGFPDRERKIVEQNSVDLRFSQSSFEEE